MRTDIVVAIVGHWQSKREADTLRDLLVSRLQRLGSRRGFVVKIIDISELSSTQAQYSVDLCVIVLPANWLNSLLHRLRQSGLLSGLVWFATPETRNCTQVPRILEAAHHVFTYSGDAHSFVNGFCSTLEDCTLSKKGRGSEALIHIDSGGGDVATDAAVIDKRQGTYIAGETVHVGRVTNIPFTPPTSLRKAERSFLPTIGVRLSASVFPTAYAYHLKSDDLPFVVCEISNHSIYPIKTVVECTIEDFGIPVSSTMEVPPQTSGTAALLPMLKHQTFSSLTEIKPAGLRLVAMTLEEGKPTVFFDQVYRIHLQARDTAVLALRSSIGEWTSLLPYLAAWVTPHHRCIEQLLRRATDYLPHGCSFGYDLMASTMEESRVNLRSQVKAIFQALRYDVGLVYLDSSLSFGHDADQLVQRVRMPAYVLDTAESANCLDGAVLYASVLESVSLQPVIVIVPEHAFVGWRIWPSRDEFEFLETTWTEGEADFEEALEKGMQAYRSAKEHGHFQRSAFDPMGFAELVDVSKCRNRGIYPFE